MADEVLLSKIDREIVQFGLRSELGRLNAAQANLCFYEGDFKNAPTRDRGNSAYDAARYPRHSLIMQRIVDVLSNTLYAEGPARRLVSPSTKKVLGSLDGEGDREYEAATDWLNACYKRNRIDAMWQHADLLAVVSECAAFQVGVTDDPDWPVEVELWDAGQFCVWFEGRKPLKPAAVAVLDVMDGRSRVRLYSSSSIRTYLARPAPEPVPMDSPLARDYRFDNEIPNPYGVLPFSFVHFRMPLTKFWSGSPGNNLRAINDGINLSLTDTFDCIRYNLDPVLALFDVRPDYRPPAPIKPGDVWNMAAASDSTMEVAKHPDAKYLQSDPSFVEAHWQDTQSMIDHTLEMNGVPPSVIRMTQDSVKSGVAIVAEQLPLIQWANKRKRAFGYYEDELARLVLKVGSKHLGSQEDDEYRATAAGLEMVSRNPGLVLKWPNMYPRIPGEDTDRADDFRLEKKLTSKTMLLMERECLTREEAEERLDEIAKDLKREQELFSEVEPDLGSALGGLGAHKLQMAAESEDGEE